MSFWNWLKRIFKKPEPVVALPPPKPEPKPDPKPAPVVESPKSDYFGKPLPSKANPELILAQLDEWYRECSIVPKYKTQVDAAVARIKDNMGRYEAVAKHFQIPGYVVALLHNMEAGGNFAGVLHNGEKIIGTGKKTSLVPAGRGPFDSWEASAIDALSIKPTKQRLGNCTVPEVLWYCERFNGLGPRDSKGNRTAYLWSMTSVYSGGKYVADHVWDGNAWSAQCGVAAIMKGLGIS